jgi:hypothetical protein
MTKRRSAASLAPLALGAVFAGHSAADAKTEEFGKVRMTGPDPIAGATAEAARAQGRLLLQANNVTQALQAYRQALAQDPESIEALNGIAVCYDRLARWEDARLHYEAALGIDPTSAMVLNNYGLSLYLQGDMRGAERFLRLAASAGDPAVQAASLRTLARMEREGRMPAKAAAVETASAEPAPQGPTIVRTSGHEQRLVLSAPKAAARVQMAAALPADRAMLAAAVGTFSADEDARIADVEQTAVRIEQAAYARAEAEREAARLLAEARMQVPADMQVAALLKAAREAAAARDESADGEAWTQPLEARLAPSPADTDWHRDQILVALPSSGNGARRGEDRAAMRMALLAAGFAPPRPAQRDALVAAAQAALGNSSPRRAFRQAFESDNARLNGFAARVQGSTEPDDDADEPMGEELSVAEKVARLEALIERVRAA